MNITGEILYAYLDGELSGRERREVENALERDSALRHKLDAIQRIEQSAAERVHRTAPAGMTARVMREVQQHAPVPAGEPEPSPKGALWVFLAVIAGLTGIAVFTPGNGANGDTGSLTPNFDWFSAFFARLGDVFAAIGGWFSLPDAGLPQLDPSDAHLYFLAATAVLLLVLLDVYVLRPRAGSNGH